MPTYHNSFVEVNYSPANQIYSFLAPALKEHDFLLVLLMLLLIATTISLVNFGQIWSFRITKNFLLTPESSRTARRSTFGGSSGIRRISRDFFHRAAGFVVPYLFLSLNDIGFQVFGLLAAVFVLGLHTKRLFALSVNPRGLLQRKQSIYVLYPEFIRARLFFEMARRYTTIFISLSTVSYGLGILFPEWFTCESQTNLSTFVLHMRSTLSGLTALVSDPFVYNSNYSNLFSMARAIYAVLVVMGLFQCLLSNAMSPDIGKSGFLNKTNGTERSTKVDEDLFIILDGVLGKKYYYHPKDHLVGDLAVDSLDVIEIQLNIEQKWSIEFSDIDPNLTVEMLIARIESKINERLISDV